MASSLRSSWRVPDGGSCFFFSSRRRHTRCYRDWSSDVCSSDLARWLALRVGVVAHPMSERWHRRPTALFGGVAVGLATVVGVGVAALLGPSYGAEIESVLRGTAVGVALSAALMFLVGLLDDVVRLRAQLKFVLQLLAGVTLLSFGGLLDVSPWYVANVVLTLFWFVALTNAFHLLVNIDGVAAG